MTYTEQPKTRAGKAAWAAFTKAIGEPPASIVYEHVGAPVGWEWSATDRNGSHWRYQAIWAKAGPDRRRTKHPLAPVQL